MSSLRAPPRCSHPLAHLDERFLLMVPELFFCLSCCRDIKDALECRAEWLALSAPAATSGAEDVTKEVVDAACSGTFPWTDALAHSDGTAAADGMDGGNGPVVAQKHFAQRYRTAKARVDRTAEEQEYLKAEVARTHNFLRVRLEEIAARIQQLDAEEAADGVQSLLARGQRSLLLRARKRWELIKAEARMRIELPVPVV